MKVGVVIPCFNRTRFTECALKSLIFSHDPDILCVVVDNASTDGTRELIKDYAERRPDVFTHVILNKENMHLGYALNQGIDWLRSRCEIVGITNNDLVFEPGWAANLRACMVDLGLDACQVERQPDEGWALHTKTTPSGGIYTDLGINDMLGPCYFYWATLANQGLRFRTDKFGHGFRGPNRPFYDEMVHRKLKVKRLQEPGILVMDVEFDAPDMKDYYDWFFRDLLNRGKRFEQVRQQIRDGVRRGGHINWAEYLAHHFPNGEPSI